MKKRSVMRVLSLLSAIILCVPMLLSTVSAATAGDGREPPVFVLLFIKEDVTIATSAFYMEDSKGDGSTYLVSDGRTAELVKQGYACVLLGVNYQADATCVAQSNNLAFYKAPGLEDMVPLKTSAKLTSNVIVVFSDVGEDRINGCAYFDLDISNWSQAGGTIYEPGTELDNIFLLGAPVMDSDGQYVLGWYSATGDKENAINLVTDAIFLSQAAIVSGDEKTQKPTATQPQQQESQQSGDSMETEIVVLIAVAVGIVVWFAAKSNKKKNTAAQPVVEPVQEETIMLTPDGNQQREMFAMDDMRGSQWQIRGLAGPMKGLVYMLNSGETVKIGRDSQCRVSFPPDTPGISGVHCELVVRRDEVALRDLQSYYGTYLENHVRLEPRVEYSLREGDAFMLADGGQVFRLERAGDRVQEYTPAVRSIIDGNVYRADREGRMTFGRDSRNQVVFDANDSAVSSMHCVLYREGGKLYLMDKNSTNGTYFDEKQRLRPNVPYAVKKGMSFFLTTPKYTFVITED